MKIEDTTLFAVVPRESLGYRSPVEEISGVTNWVSHTEYFTDETNGVDAILDRSLRRVITETLVAYVRYQMIKDNNSAPLIPGRVYAWAMTSASVAEYEPKIGEELFLDLVPLRPRHRFGWLSCWLTRHRITNMDFHSPYAIKTCVSGVSYSAINPAWDEAPSEIVFFGDKPRPMRVAFETRRSRDGSRERGEYSIFIEPTVMRDIVHWCEIPRLEPIDVLSPT